MVSVPGPVFPMVRSESGDHAGIPSPENGGVTSAVLVMAASVTRTDDTKRKKAKIRNLPVCVTFFKVYPRTLCRREKSRFPPDLQLRSIKLPPV